MFYRTCGTIFLMLCVSTVTAQHHSLRYSERVSKTIDPHPLRIPFIAPSFEKTLTLSYQNIDTSSNAYGPASVYVNPVSFDPYSGTLVVIHRGKSTYNSGGSGAIFYAYSTNYGSSWSKRVGPLSNGILNNSHGRYPTIALHNPSKAASKESIFVQAVWPVLLGDNFGGLIYSSDPGVGTNSPLVGIDSTGRPWSAGMSTPTVLGDPSYLFAAEYYPAAGKGNIAVFTSPFGIDFSRTVPPQLSDTVFAGDSIDGISGVVFRDGIYFIGIRAKFVRSPETERHRYTFGVTRSTNKGATWSPLDIVPWKGLVPPEYAYNLFSNDFIVDGDSGYHFLTVGADTTRNPELWSLFHLYKPNGGTWSALKIKDLPPHRNYSYGTVDQTLIENQLAVSADGKAVVAKWIEDNRGPQFADSLPINDVWSSYWTRKTGWSYSVNRSNTPNVNDQLTHIAQYAADDSPVLIRHQSILTAGNSPGMDVDITGIYFSRPPVVHPPPGTITVRAETPYRFTLAQNYPNPFNPVTTIMFTLPVSGPASLKIFNVLGQETAVLLDEEQPAGEYTLTWNASALASGIYYYRLESNGFAQTRKMSVIK